MTMNTQPIQMQATSERLKKVKYCNLVVTISQAGSPSPFYKRHRCRVLDVLRGAALLETEGGMKKKVKLGELEILPEDAERLAEYEAKTAGEKRSESLRKRFSEDPDALQRVRDNMAKARSVKQQQQQQQQPLPSHLSLVPSSEEREPEPVQAQPSSDFETWLQMGRETLLDPARQKVNELAARHLQLSIERDRVDAELKAARAQLEALEQGMAAFRPRSPT